MLAGLALALLAAPSPQGGGPWEGFPAFLWREPREQPDGALTRELVRALGGTQVLRGEEAAWVRELGLPWYVFNAAGRGALHAERSDRGWARRWRAWYRTRDDALLVREPCLSAPATRAGLAATLAASLRAHPGAHGFSLGDEVTLTADAGPEDVCLSPTCRAAWRAFLQRPELGLDAGERARLADPAASNTDPVRLAVADGQRAALQGWLLRRRFHQEVLLARLEELAVQVRCEAPGAAVALLGLSGRTAFGGVSIERVLPWLDVVEAYREGLARELALSLREPRQRALLTVFAREEDPDHAAWQAWEHWLRGGDGVVVWSESALARAPALAQRLARALADLRAADAAAAPFAPRPAGVALVHDDDSLAASWLRDALLDGPTWPRRLASHQRAHGTLETAQAGWLRLLEDCGLQPGALPLDAVGAASARRFPLLVLERLLVLDEQDLLRLEAHLDAGGHLLVHGELGWCDARGRPLQAPALERLRARGSGRVVVVEGAIDGYPLAREQRLAAGELWRERARGWLDAAGVASAPFELAGAAEGAPWLRAWSRADDGTLWCAALPAEGAAPPVEVALEVRAPPGLAVRWIHPRARDGEVPLLPAGDAAVFALVPGD